ncbi:MAG: glycosyltransferase family A protein [Terrimicrobiaceae bacterium]
MTSAPAISVCIPAFNEAEFIRDAVYSVVKQTCQDWELVIVGNCLSQKATKGIELLQLELNDPRIRVLCNHDRMPMAENWNAAVCQARGRFLKLLCHDDVLLDHCLEQQSTSLKEHPSATVAAGARTIMNARGCALFTRSGIRRTGLYNGREIIRRCLLAGTNIVGDPVCVMWRRTDMEMPCLFDPSVLYCTDVEMWLRMLGGGNLYYDTRPVGCYRIHGKAAAVGLAGVTVRDFLHMAELQEKRGTVSLSFAERWIIAIKSRVKSLGRQAVYTILGG